MCSMFFAAPDISGLEVKISLANALTLVRMGRSSFSSESMSLRMALIALFPRGLVNIYCIYRPKKKNEKRTVIVLVSF